MTTLREFISPVPTLATLRDAFIAHLQTRLPSWEPNESDPGYYIAEYFASEFIAFINQYNFGAAESFAPTASSNGLVRLLDNAGVEDAVGTRAQLLTQYRDRWNALAASTEEFARRLIRTFNTDIIDVRLTRDTRRSIAFVFATKANGEALSIAERTTLEEQLNDDSEIQTKVIWWDYKVLSALHVSYTLAVEIHYRDNLIALVDLKERVESVLDVAVNNLARPGAVVSQNIIASILYSLNTPEAPIIAYVMPTLTPTRPDDPTDWISSNSPLGGLSPVTFVNHNGRLQVGVPGIRRVNPVVLPVRLVTNDFEPLKGQYIKLTKIGSQYFTEGYIDEPIIPTTLANEVGIQFDIRDAIHQGSAFQTGIGGNYQFGPRPNHVFLNEITGVYMPADRGIVYGPGTFDSAVDLTYVVHND